MASTRLAELRRLRSLLDHEWPGFAQSVEAVALPDAAPAIALAFAELGWSPLMALSWPDPRSTRHEDLVREWIDEGRLEYERGDGDGDGDADPDPAAVDTAFCVARTDLPARLRVLRQSTEGGDFALWVADETTGDDDPAVLELNLRPTWPAEPGPGVFVRAIGERASAFVATWMSRDLAEQRAHCAAVGLTEPSRCGDPLLPELVPELCRVAPHVYLERDIGAGDRPHRLTSHDLTAMNEWVAALPARVLIGPSTILTVDSVVRLPLSARVRSVIAAAFTGPDAATVTARLYDDITLSTRTAGRVALFERVRLAVLKLAHANRDSLDRAIELAAIDWRDLLVNAGFGDPDAHIAWADGIIAAAPSPP